MGLCASLIYSSLCLFYWSWGRITHFSNRCSRTSCSFLLLFIYFNFLFCYSSSEIRFSSLIRISERLASILFLRLSTSYRLCSYSLRDFSRLSLNYWSCDSAALLAALLSNLFFSLTILLMKSLWSAGDNSFPGELTSRYLLVAILLF